jgi:tetratricopeptide (TPR) repeat protein
MWNPSRDNNDPNLAVEAQIAEIKARITRIEDLVQRAIDSQQEQQNNDQKGFFTRMYSGIWSKGVTIPLIIGVVILIVGLVRTGIPLWEIPEVAAEKYRQAHLLDEQVQRHLVAGDSFLDDNRPEAAQAQFQKVLELDPRNADAELGLAKAELFIPVEGKYYDPSVAAQKLTQFLKERHVNPKTCVGRGADQSFIRDILGLKPREDPANTHVYAGLGNLAQANQTARTPLKNAMNCYNHAISLDKGNSYAYFGKGAVYHQKGKLEKALKMYNLALTKSPNNQEYLNNKAYALYEANENKGDIERAININENINTWDPWFLVSYFDVIHMYRVREELTKAHSKEIQLIELLENEEVMSLERNQGDFFFDYGGSDPVVISGLSAKRYYAYYGTALTTYLLGHEKEAQKYKDRAMNLNLDNGSESQIKRLIEFEIQALQDEHNRVQCENFREKFL